MLRLEQRVNPSAAVVDAEQDREVLLHLASKSYYNFNLIGMRIWQAIKAGLRSPMSAVVCCRVLSETDLDTSVPALVNEVGHRLMDMAAGGM